MQWVCGLSNRYSPIYAVFSLQGLCSGNARVRHASEVSLSPSDITDGDPENLDARLEEIEELDAEISAQLDPAFIKDPQFDRYVDEAFKAEAAVKSEDKEPLPNWEAYGTPLPDMEPYSIEHVPNIMEPYPNSVIPEPNAIEPWPTDSAPVPFKEPPIHTYDESYLAELAAIDEVIEADEEAEKVKLVQLQQIAEIVDSTDQPESDKLAARAEVELLRDGLFDIEMWLKVEADLSTDIMESCDK